jgi:lipid II isoglutaminyl synthase (glutamine-hydrolysing)
MEKYLPSRLKKFLGQFDKVIFITGTNGKTTTSRAVIHLLKSNNISYISNSSGSNLIRGIISELIDKANLLGKINAGVAVFEVEEATMPKLVTYVKPDVIIVTNIFRDQLDAYGEIDKTYQYIIEAIKLSDNPKLVLNKNDQRVESMAGLTTNEVFFISFDPKYLDLIKLENRDSQTEVEDKEDSIQNIYQISGIRIDDNLTSIFDVINIHSDKTILHNYSVKIPGYHNTYNAVAALLSLTALFDSTLEESSLNLNLDDFIPVFGRGEIITFKNTSFQILLGKNPAGLNLNLKLLESVKNREALLLMLNDNTADGKDVSWIWDCDFSILKKLGFKNIFFAGSRRYDMALRVKYEGIEICDCKDKETCDCEKKNIFESSSIAIEKLSEKGFEKVFTLPTYTAMLDLRKELGKRTAVKKMYE